MSLKPPGIHYRIGPNRSSSMGQPDDETPSLVWWRKRDMRWSWAPGPWTDLETASPSQQLTAFLVRDDLGDSQRTKTLAHELTHVLLHGDDPTPLSCTGRPLCGRVEAESVAFLVCGHLGIDSATCSIAYVAGWSGGDVDLMSETAESVTRTATELFESLGDSAAGFDLTFPAPKSVSLLAVYGNRDLSGEVRRAHAEACRGAFDWLEGETCGVRKTT